MRATVKKRNNNSAMRQAAVDLDALLARITDENVHGEVDFGRSVGKEKPQVARRKSAVFRV